MKIHMEKHLRRKNICPTEKHDIDLSEDVIETVLTKRKYLVPPDIMKPRKHSDNVLRNLRKQQNGHIYIVHLREFVNKNEQTYKIGNTKHIDPCMRAVSGYPKGTLVKFTLEVTNSYKLEKEVIRFFKNKYQHKSEYGREYFNGDLNDMIDDIIALSRRGDACFEEEEESLV